MYYGDRTWGDIPEELARKRRYRLFVEASGMQEITLSRSDFYRWNSPKHGRTYDIVKHQTEGWLDHVSAWIFGNCCILLTEAYYKNTPEHYQHNQLYSLELPVEISPYCGGWNPDEGSFPRTRSVLITNILKARQLDRIYETLREAATTAPPWNYVGEEP